MGESEWMQAARELLEVSRPAQAITRDALITAAQLDVDTMTRLEVEMVLPHARDLVAMLEHRAERLAADKVAGVRR